MTSIETPRLLSEYFAARAQSDGSISANATVDVRKRSAKIDKAGGVAMKRGKARGGSPRAPCRRRDHAHRGRLRSIAPTLWRGSRGCRPLSARAHGQMMCAQLFHIWQFVQIAQTKVIEEKLRRFVEKRSAGNFGASANFHQA